MTFRTALDEDEFWARIEERMPKFRELPGLAQKYYVTDPKTGEVGGFYLFESAKAADDYLASDLRATIGKAYEVEGEPTARRFEVRRTLFEPDG